MKKFASALWLRVCQSSGWLYRKSPSLDTVQQYVDTTSGWLSWIAILSSLLAGGVTFLAVLALAILPYVTITHCLYVGPVLACIVAFLVYGMASRPSGVVDKASWIVWLTNHSVRLVQYLITKFRKQTPPPSQPPSSTP